MGAGAIELLATSTDLTPYTDLDSFSVEYQANKLNGILDCVVRDEDGSLLGLIKERADIAVTDGGTRIFGGQIATLKPALDGTAVDYHIKAQSFDCLLDQRVIEDGLRNAAGRYDDDDVVWICSFASDLGLDASAFVSRIRTVELPSIDYSGKTLRQALELLASYTTGAVSWVDMNKSVHWQHPQSAQLVDNPDFENAGVDWSLDGSASVDEDGGPGGTGDAALTVTGDGSGTHGSFQNVLSIVGDRRYVFFADLYSTIASAAVIDLDWQDVSSVSQRIDTITNGATTSSWVRAKSILTAPASATKVIITLRLPSGSTAASRWDNVNLVGEDAAFGVSTTPNGTTTQRMFKWSQPTDAATPINRVLVQGDGISGWREHAASIAYYGGRPSGVFEGFLSDDRVTTSDGIDSRAQYVFNQFAFPAHSGTYQTTVTGLQAGTWQIIEVEPLGLEAIEWLATITTRFDGNLNMLYEVTYGAPTDDIGALAATMASAFSGTTGQVGVEDPHIPGTDATPPAVPAGLSLTSGTNETPDGTLQPYLIASWTVVADVDLDAYELALDRAILGDITFTATASGTGGGLPAGDYAVQVTGVGSVSGETSPVSAPQVVTVAAGQRLYVNITAQSGIASYKVYASILTASEEQPRDTGQTTTTTGSDVEVTAAGASAVYPPASSTAVAFVNPTVRRARDNSHYTEDVLGGVYYAARVRALDVSGNASAWSSIVGAVAAEDTSAPVIPAGVVLSTGYRIIGVRWQRNSEDDLGRYEVRWAPETSPGSGVPDTESWDRLSTLTNWALITDLEAGSADGTTPPTTYFVQVRAIDRSDNVATSAVDSTAVPATTNSEAGWSNDGTNESYISAAPVLLAGATDVAYGTILTDHITASGLDASIIKAGTISVGGQPNTPDFFIVYDTDGNEIGRWDQHGLVIVDPSTYPPSSAATAKAVRVVGGVLAFSTTYNPYDSADAATSWTTALSGDGISADAITLGTAPGGHNAIPNASFELAAFSSLLSTGWEAGASWSTTIGTDVNVTKNAADLRLTDYTS